MDLKISKYRILLIFLFIFVIFVIYINLNYFSIMENIFPFYNLFKNIIYNNYILSIIIFVIIYIASVAVSFPISTFLTILSGFLFGSVLGSILSIISATIGSIGIYILCQSVFRVFYKKKTNILLNKFSNSFKVNAFSYLLFLRLIPVIPFFAVNMLAGLLKVNFNSYLFSTIIGIAPASFVFASFGSGADSVILNKKLPGIEIFLDIKFVLPVLIIFCLFFIRLVYRLNKSKNYNGE